MVNAWHKTKSISFLCGRVKQLVYESKQSNDDLTNVCVTSTSLLCG
ncbi:hypothetical protein Nmel_000462, partial [Mimus melanotis]